MKKVIIFGITTDSYNKNRKKFNVNNSIIIKNR